MLLIYAARSAISVLTGAGVVTTKHIEVVRSGWRELSAHIVDTANRLSQGQSGRGRLIVGMDRYAIASELAVLRRAHTPRD